MRKSTIDHSRVTLQNPPVQSDPTHRHESVWDSIRWRGPLYSLLLATREVLRPLFYWYAWHIFSTDLQKAIPEPYAKKQVAIEVLCGSSAIEAAICQIVPLGQLTPQQIRTRMEDGGAVAIARVGDEPAGYSWLSFTNGGILVYELSWILAPDEALRYGAFVSPKWRGLGIHSALNNASNCYARDRGLHRTLASIGVFNRQSLNLAKHARKRKSMTVFVLHINGLNWTYARAFGAPLESRFSRSPTKSAPFSPLIDD
jgi:GNAT superfamily N-acetyltransferase